MIPSQTEERRLVQARRQVTLAVGLIGMAVCALAGGPILGLSVLGAIFLVVGRRTGRDTPRAQARWRVLNTSALVLCLLLAFARVPLLMVATGLVAWLQVHRAFTGPGARDDRVALLLALLQALLGCVLSVSLLLAPLFLALTLLAPVALGLCHLGLELEQGHEHRVLLGGERPRLPTILALGPGILVLTFLFFLGLPRLHGGSPVGLESADRVTGFGEDVDLGDLGPLLESEAVVMRVRASTEDGRPWTEELYLRGAALDHFDGERWTMASGSAGPWRETQQLRGELIRQEILLEPLSENVLFGMHEVVLLQGIGRRVERDANGALRFEGEPTRLQYQATSRRSELDTDRLRAATPDPRMTARSRGELRAARSGAWTQLPPDLDPRIPALAAQLAAEAGPGASPWDRAVAIAVGLKEGWTWTLTPVPPADGRPPQDPLAWFLFDSRQGHCEYFATALAVMLRSQDIPARVVNGFLGGELNPLGGWVTVRQRDAHSWVEVNMGPHGWITMDATPSGGETVVVAAPWTQALDWAERRWQGLVLDYELDDQVLALAWLGRAFAPGSEVEGIELGGLPLSVLGGLGAVLLTGLVLVLALRGGLGLWIQGVRRPSPRGRVERRYQRARRFVERKGWRPPPAMPPVEAAAWVVARAGEPARPLEALAWLLYGVRYGGRPDEEAAREAGILWKQLQRGGLGPAPDAAGGEDRD